MFYALAIVCDDYFVPSLEKISEVSCHCGWAPYERPHEAVTAQFVPRPSFEMRNMSPNPVKGLANEKHLESAFLFRSERCCGLLFSTAFSTSDNTAFVGSLGKEMRLNRIIILWDMYLILGCVRMLFTLRLLPDLHFYPCAVFGVWGIFGFSLCIIISFHLLQNLQLSEDVAGATFMAAGSSAPELFTSLIGQCRGHFYVISVVLCDWSQFSNTKVIKWVLTKKIVP